MFALNLASHQHRRGIVLILVLGMLSLLALIGITFATFSGQAQVGARNFAQGFTLPDANQVLDYGLSQLIYDTHNPVSALRGHSLGRDMYGNDAQGNGFLGTLPAPYGTELYFMQGRSNPVLGLPQFRVNVPTSTTAYSMTPTLFGVDFSRWFVRLSAWTQVDPADGKCIFHPAQTFEVIADDNTGSDPFSQGKDSLSGISGPMHLLTLSGIDATTHNPFNNNVSSPTPANPIYYGKPVTLSLPIDPNSGGPFIDPTTSLPVPLVLDGRYRRAFNGPGMSALNRIYTDPGGTQFPIVAGQYANFRLNGNILNPTVNNVPITPMVGNPDAVGMDEDYDACDLENWFLAIQSADGQVVIPSFHRPGILTAGDWISMLPTSAAKFLRPRAIDHAPGNPFRDLVPDANGRITYDVDNDGDGVTDAVWLDLGYPAQRDAAGKLFKPLFAFTVIGLNGRMPLNTVGNLQGRDLSDNNRDGLPDCNPTWDHTSHLGYSVSEINPKFALQNAPGYSQFDNTPLAYFNNTITDPNTGMQGIGVDVTQLRNLLTGTRPQINPLVRPDLSPNNGTNGDTNAVAMGSNIYYMPNNIADPADLSAVRNTPAVPGRWGEPTGIPTVLPDLGALSGLSTNYRYLSFNNVVRAGRSSGYPQPQFPASFVALYNVDGTDDDYNTYDFWALLSDKSTNPPSYTPTIHPEDGDHLDLAGMNDLPSERLRRFVSPIDPAGTGRVLPYNYAPVVPPGGGFDYGTGYDKNGRVGFFAYFRPPGVPLQVDNSNGFSSGLQTPVIPDVTSNPYHGFESRRFPTGAGTASGAMTNASPYIQATYPTFSMTDQISRSDPPDGPNGGAVQNGYTEGSIARDVADEMFLYGTTHYDAPFGPGDLEYLYRKQDVDGASISSRLASLAPISFENDRDGSTRKRLFSIDTWETTNFAWANDNPSGAFQNNSLLGLSASPFSPQFNSSVEMATNILGRIVQTPSLAHRDRKINLNFPFPVSNDPREPVRQKWIRETYELLKTVLPPRATDTPAELAALSQYVVNIVDFRDADGAMTMFTNPDLFERPGATNTAPTLVPAANALPTDYPLVQFGMEYNPIAINEIFAGFVRIRATKAQGIGKGLNKKKTATIMLVELVNTLTQGKITTASDLNLANWDLVVMPDNPDGRPDPATGQVPTRDNIGTFKVANQPSYVSGPAYPGLDAGLTSPVPALAGSGPADGTPGYYYALGNFLLDGAGDNNPDWGQVFDPPPPATFPNATLALRLVQALDPTSSPGQNQGNYFWLYLRRPANPLAPIDNNASSSTYNPSVVVDAFRFPYVGANVNDGSGGGIQTDVDLYSMQRLQPSRGGHSVPLDRPTDAGAILPANYYGYTEQTTPPRTLSDVVTGLNVKDKNGNSVNRNLYMKIQEPNDPSDPSWDYVPFHDRDFTSVMELLLVPGVPPGLFTKKFTEQAPVSATSPAFDNEYSTAPIRTDYLNGQAGTPFDTRVPHSFPYLPDNFYYTALSDPTTQVGMSNGAGWFKMLEFFEVPSSALGAIGPVAQGQNFDWFRQDLKPGLINLNLIIDEEVFFGLVDDPRLNLNVVGPAPGLPHVVTQVDQNGYPTASYPFPNRGFWNSANNTALLKAAFSDFLKLRHGGSGFLFAWQNGQTGSGSARFPTNPTTPVAVERPFHSLSYPDIDYTLLRPATLPPSFFTSPAANSTAALYAGDPGLKNPNLDTQTGAPRIPPIPPRRLFEVPDAYGSVQPVPAQPSSNASELGAPYINHQIQHPDLANPNANLVNNTLVAPNTAPTLYLGATSNADERQHPYFRTEWLQKVANLSTVRTHQYAVWVTVGFFEVTQLGNPQLAVPDTLGQEMGLSGGRNTRFRSFFIIDRTKAVGFNTVSPGVASNDFRDCVTYRRRIE